LSERPPPLKSESRPRHSVWRQQLYDVIFEADTAWGKGFDVALLWVIILSMAAVMLESVADIEVHFGFYLRVFEWIFTILFTIEYLARLIAVRHPFQYAFSFFGVVDLIAVIPTYLSLFLWGGQYLLVIRTLRLLRVFRILKLGRYVSESQALMLALQASRHKITVFMLSVVTVVTIMGTLMYMVEGGQNGFTSIPRSIYWAIVTLTTVGYGDIAPKTIIGQTLSSFIMIVGYAIIAIPTGIVTVELSNLQEQKNKAEADARQSDPCSRCHSPSRDPGALFCKFCGTAFG